MQRFWGRSSKFYTKEGKKDYHQTALEFQYKSLKVYWVPVYLRGRKIKKGVMNINKYLLKEWILCLPQSNQILNPGFKLPSLFSRAFISAPLRRCLLWPWRNLPCCVMPLPSPWFVLILFTALMRCAQRRWVPWTPNPVISSIISHLYSLETQFQGFILVPSWAQT